MAATGMPVPAPAQQVAWNQAVPAVPGMQSLLHPVAVFGQDDRQDLPVAYRALAFKIGTMTDLRSRMQCTAFCVSETVVATASHCLFRTRNEPRPDLAGFRFKLHGRPAASAVRIAGTHTGAAVPHVAAGSMDLNVRPPIEATRDWALVRLERPACSAGGLPLSARRAADLTALPPAQQLYQIGYHRDFPAAKLAFGSPCRVSRSFSRADWKTISSDFSDASELILHSCDTGGASSGSPLLIDGDNGPEVVGINVGTYVQSRVLMLNGTVTHRYQSENVANTAVGVHAFQQALRLLDQTRFISTRNDMREVQALLSGMGVYSGPRTGAFNGQSAAAIKVFEHMQGLPITGLATAKVLDALRASNIATVAKPQHEAAPRIETGSINGLGVTSSAKTKVVP